MKKLTMIIGIMVLAGVAALPFMALGQGWGWGHHMMGNWGHGPAYSGGYQDLSSEQRSKLNALERKFYDDTKDLRDQIWAKSRELDSALDNSSPDLDKVKALQKEISELRAKMDEKTLAFQVEARKIAPDQRFGYGPGDRHMGPYGSWMGYGPGYCRY